MLVSRCHKLIVVVSMIISNSALFRKLFLKMNFDSLPSEIKYQIFSLLTDKELQSVASVSKQWFKISQDPFFRKNCETNGKNLWQTNHLIQKYRRLQSISIFQLCDCEPWVNGLPENFHVRKLFLSDCHFKSTGTLSKVFQRVPRLYEFNFINCTFDEFDCPTSIEDCKLLKCLILGYHDQYKENHTCTDIFLQKCSNIEQLHIICHCTCDLTFKTEIFNQNSNLKVLSTGCESLSENSYPLLSNCHQMTKLILISALQLTNKGLMIMKKLQHLKLLQIRQSSTNADFVHLFDGASFNEMNSLCLADLPNLQNNIIKLIGESCQALREFTLMECLLNLDNGLCVLVRKCVYLEKLMLVELSLTTGKFLKLIPKNVPNLCRLEVDQCDSLRLRDLSILKTQRPNIVILDPAGNEVEFSYSSWMLQSLLDRYDALKGQIS